MSANNWGICPRCVANAEKAKNAAAEKVRASYGKLPIDRWQKARKEAEAMPNGDENETLREDYELYTDSGGELFVSYRCDCTVCGFSHSFEHKEQLKV
jgi:hypothetical protein